MSHWVPDEEGQGCFICHSDFSLVRRRHHCRKCGALVCGSCSDHFLPVNAESAARVCDNCELQLKEAIFVSERLDVNGRIGESLKFSLREKSHEIELYRTFSEQYLPEDIPIICMQYMQFLEAFNLLKASSAELEREIRAVAQRCLRAESLAKQTVVMAKEIEQYSQQIGHQQKLMTQLQERLVRLADGRSTRGISDGRRSPTEAAEIRPGAPTLWQLAKSLLF